MNRTVDYTALFTPVTPVEISSFKKRMRDAGVTWGGGTVATAVTIVVVIVVGAFLVLPVIGGLAAVFAATVTGDVSGGGAVGGVIGLLVIAGIVVLGVFLIRRSIVRSWETWYRLSNFAGMNGMVFSPSDKNPQYPGAIFNVGDSRQALNHLRSATDRYLDIGNYQYSTGSGKSRSTHTWGFMALHLDRKLPNIVLDAKANNGLFGGTNLPAYFAKDQILSLEGNFNEFFTLYCPKQYERDALYIFTPDLMALLIDHAAPFDVEIVDDWMFVYSSVPFKSTDPAVYQRLFRIVDTVGAKTLSQTDRYVDERIGSFAANVVAPQGQRLKRGFSVVALVVILIWAATWFLPWIVGMFAR